MGAVEACHGAPEFEIKPILADLTKYEVLKNTAEISRLKSWVKLSILAQDLGGITNVILNHDDLAQVSQKKL